MVIISTVLSFIISCYFIKMLWIIRLGSLAHWSYLIGSVIYPNNPHNNAILSCTIFGFILIGAWLPKFLCPRVKFVATALSIFPQIHLLLLLHKTVGKIENQQFHKAIKGYSAITIGSMFWTIFTLVKY